MKRRTCRWGWVVLAWMSGGAGAAEPPFLQMRLSSVIPRSSVAATEGALATAWNPAALDARPEPDFVYLRTLKGATAKDDAFFFSLYGFGLGLEYGSTRWEGRRLGYRRTTLAGGSALGKGLYWGTARSAYASKGNPSYDDLTTWDVGLLARRRWSALGVVARNVNRPLFNGARLERVWEIGGALRPGTERLTLAFDLLKSDAESFRTAWRRRRFVGSLEVEPLDGFRIAGSAYGDGQFEIRGVLSLGHFGLGSGSRLDRGSPTAHVAFLNVHRGLSPSLLRRRSHAVVVTPDEWKSAYWEIRRDPRVKGVVVRLDGERMALAQWQEFRAQLVDLKAKGLQVAAYLRNAGTGGYWLASAADTLLADPLAEVALVGIRSDTLYYRRALDRLGVQTQFERLGAFKSGTEPYTQDAPSEPVVKNTEAVLDDLYAQLVGDLAVTLGEPEETVRRLIDEGPYLGKELVASGLVDDVAPPDEAEKRLVEEFGRLSMKTFKEYRRERLRPRTWAPRPERLALIRLEGIMVEGKNAEDPLTGTRFAGAETLAAAIEQAASDSSVKAIVVDVESGGGLVAAAERLWRQLQAAKKKKPVIARIGGIGASGAYYVASGADWIVAEPASVTGSIGVYAGRFSFQETLAKLGVTTASSQRGANADYDTPYAPLREAHRDVLKEHVQTSYDLFLERVSKGRKMTTEAVEAVAQGQVWTGRQALERGLVDELGGLAEAFRAAKRLARVPESRLLEVETLPKPTWAERLAAWGVVSAGRRGWESLARARVFVWLPWTVRG